ncbi:TlpA family protein disulfide reductase [Micromonospora sonneratiae]
MMWYLTVAVVLVAALGLVNLVFTLGVVRRLREHTELLSDRQTKRPEAILEGGGAPDDFVSTTVDGQVLTRDSLRPMTLIAFVSPACDLCEEQIPTLLDRARDMPGGRDNVWVVVVGKGPETAPYADRFRDVATVFVEPGNGSLPIAFKVNGFPAFGLLDEGGRAVASTFGIARLDLPVAR